MPESGSPHQPEQRTYPVPARYPSIALALGGGGARGLGHIAMLEVLDEMGIRPKLIAGTSIGAIIGAAYASGIPARSIRAHTERILRHRFDLARQIFSARATPIQRIMSLIQLKSHVLRSDVLLKLLMPAEFARSFEDLQIPLKIIAADIRNYEEVVFDRGPLVPAVAASMALPALFSPVMHEGHMLLDGGLVNPLPFDVIEGQADVTIAIDVSGIGDPADMTHEPTALEALVTSSQLLQNVIVRERLKRTQPDIYIDLPVAAFGMLDIHKHRDIFAACDAAKPLLRRQIERVLNAPTLAAE